MAGRKPAHTAMMLIPEPWTENTHMSKEKGRSTSTIAP